MPSQRQTFATPGAGRVANVQATGAYRSMTNPQWKDAFVTYWASQWAQYKRLPSMSIEGMGLPGATDYVDANGLAQLTPSSVQFFARLADAYQPGMDPEYDSISPWVPPGQNDYIETPEEHAARLAADQLTRQNGLDDQANQRLRQQLDDYYALESAGMELEAQQIAGQLSAQLEQINSSNLGQAGQLALGQQQIADNRTSEAIRYSADPGDFVARESASRNLPVPQASMRQGFANVSDTGGIINQLRQPVGGGLASQIAGIRGFKPPARPQSPRNFPTNTGSQASTSIPTRPEVVSPYGPPPASRATPQVPPQQGGFWNNVLPQGLQSAPLIPNTGPNSWQGLPASAFQNPGMNFNQPQQTGWGRRLPGYAQGGMTNEPKFVTGEQGPEVINNPTGAPIGIQPNSGSTSMTTNTAYPSTPNPYPESGSMPYPEGWNPSQGGTPEQAAAHIAANVNAGIYFGSGYGGPGWPQSSQGGMQASQLMIPSYNDEAYRNLPTLKYLQGRLGSEYNNLATGTTPGAFGTKIPEAGLLNWRKLYDVAQDPVASAMMDSLYRSASRSFSAESSRARARAPIGGGLASSLIRT